MFPSLDYLPVGIAILFSQYDWQRAAVVSELGSHLVAVSLEEHTAPSREDIFSLLCMVCYITHLQFTCGFLFCSNQFLCFFFHQSPEDIYLELNSGGVGDIRQSLVSSNDTLPSDILVCCTNF